MYTSSNLILYGDADDYFINSVLDTIAECNIPFKQIKTPTLISPMIKNQQNYVILLINNKDFLQLIEKHIRFCHNFQDRVLAVYTSEELVDYFFNNFCLLNQLHKLKNFILTNAMQKNISTPNKTSDLLKRLIACELINIGISNKYIGFQYLVDIIANAFSKHFFVNSYIDLFQQVAYTYLTKVDTIERDVRHMLIKTWKDNEKFRKTLHPKEKIDKPNAKTLLSAILNHLKTVI